MTEFNAFLYSHRLIDTYTNHLHDDEPRAMTHMSAQRTSYSRLDRFYHSMSIPSGYHPGIQVMSLPLDGGVD